MSMVVDLNVVYHESEVFDGRVVSKIGPVCLGSSVCLPG